MTEHYPTDRDLPDGAAVALAAEIRRLRNHAGLSQKQLAAQVGYTRQYVSLAERVGGNLPSLELTLALDTRLDAGGGLLALREQARADQRALRHSLPAATASAQLPEFASPFPLAFPPVDRVDGSQFGISTPAGRFFAGSTIPATSYPAVEDGRVVVRVPTGLADDLTLRRPGRSLVIGAADGPAGPRLFGLDNRVARTRLAKAVDGAPLLIPGAYELDDLTLGVLWSVANLDDALLDDDSALAAAEEHLRGFDSTARSTGGRDLAADLTAVSRMWLGSDFCARHILRHADALHEVPAFWTREQRGEESSTWMLFAHKHNYLARTAAIFATTGAKPTRTFCVPPETVTDSPRHERILLVLAVALMESFDIAVQVCAEPEYSSVTGFALEQGRRAIVANWVGHDGIWQVDVTDDRPTLREFADACGYAEAHSVIAGPTPSARLRALADYLDLDWAWLTRRCADLGDYGTAGLAQPRSRLLSTTGLDSACRFLGGLGTRHTAQ
ncbi:MULTISPECIES: helix-turn-helix transcriptional regulator [unclassified Crossiella]|uniref:helix-turn-helix transcriptional regulator n=1 Tax=unclassified Crossiella TaxID=2620835 RepID=UPI001FFEDA3B|nr:MULTISPECIES: helix-turn-helix transcriptional regulator [unclassified Crossiella]MCK2241003.1 helix-turn-helix domain-containing protein [Crossiella sp. S99.2]MCK2253853.1 helix-turn-helix domain-containing protein [Crossiella sp. S99.1]